MAYIGKNPTPVPLTSSDITDGIITTTKIADDAISAAKLAAGVGGKVLQVVEGSTTTQVAIASTSYTDTGITASITPSSASSKILVSVTIQFTAYRDNNASLRSYVNLVRGATQVYESPEALGSQVGTGTSGYQQIWGTIPLIYLDSPSSTSSVTYKVQGKNYNTSNNRQLKVSTSSSRSTITLTEVSA
jgi:hypothetical protein